MGEQGWIGAECTNRKKIGLVLLVTFVSEY